MMYHKCSREASVVAAVILISCWTAVLVGAQQGKEIGYIRKDVPSFQIPAYKTVLVGPGLVAGDFNGDGREDVCCLRSRRFWDWPLATLSYVDESGGYRDLSVSTREMRRYSYAAPLGPRVSGQMSVPIVHQSYAVERAFHLEGN